MRNFRTTAVLVACVLACGANYCRAQDWPQWRGPNRDNKVAGFTEPKTWPKELTKKWTVKVGLGDAPPVLVGDKIYVFTREGKEEVVRCLDAATGDQKWQDKYPAAAVSGPAGGHPAQLSRSCFRDGREFGGRECPGARQANSLAAFLRPAHLLVSKSRGCLNAIDGDGSSRVRC